MPNFHKMRPNMVVELGTDLAHRLKDRGLVEVVVPLKTKTKVDKKTKNSQNNNSQ